MVLKELKKTKGRIGSLEAYIFEAPRPIKLKTPLTKEENVVELGGILCIKGSSIVRIIHKEEQFFYHYNLDHEKIYTFTTDDGTKIKINCSVFCNDISGEDILNAPEVGVRLILTNLESPNAGDGYYVPTEHLKDNLSIFEIDKVIRCSHCGIELFKDMPALNLIMNICPSCMQDNGLESNTTAIKEKGYYIKRKNEDKYRHTSRKTLKTASLYYDVIPASIVKEQADNIPKVNKDVICLGLGSAGTSILEQIARTNLVNSFVLVDFDSVEEKNIRNQFYTSLHEYKSKAEASAEILKTLNKTAVKYHESKFEDVNFSFTLGKYTILGFDKIKTRLNAFEKIKTKDMESKYIIDVRYNDLDASIYFVDMSNEREVNYYYQSLLQDYKNLDSDVEEDDGGNEAALVTIPEFLEFCEKTNLLRNTCSEICAKFFGGNCFINFCERKDLTDYVRTTSSCLGGACKEEWVRLINERGINPWAMMGMHRPSRYFYNRVEESGCVAWNINHVYKFASSFVTSAILEIENERAKPFTHVEVTCNGMPNAMKLL